MENDYLNADFLKFFELKYERNRAHFSPSICTWLRRRREAMVNKREKCTYFHLAVNVGAELNI